MPDTNTTTVAIFGGGVGGLTAAQELVERGYEVHVYEKNEICGGKARSLAKPGTGTGPRPDLPGEHGFRFFPGFYQHLDDTMKRIPVGSLTGIAQEQVGPSSALIGQPSAFDNLVDARDFAIAQEGKKLYVLPPAAPKTLVQWIAALGNIFGNQSLGLDPDEDKILVKRILWLFAMCKERREKDYECVSWFDYHNVPNQRSDQYNKMFVTGFSRAFVAMDAHQASTMTGANILAQFFRVFFGTGTMDRVLNAPTNDAWLTPWVAYLEHKGVHFHMQEKLTGLSVDTSGAAKIASAIVQNTATGLTSSVTADYYVAAVPVEVMAPLAQSIPGLTTAAPSLARINNLKWSWMTGIMFYSSQNFAIAQGHVNFADSKWALTGISQPQFWPNDQLANYGNGLLDGLLSIVISEWDEPGDRTFGSPSSSKTAKQCTAQEIADETWAQIYAHLSPYTAGLPQTTPDFFLDPAISFPQGGPVQNEEPLLVNTACSLSDRPNEATGLQNLMLASDYVRTNVDLATMEGANEAGRRAANAINAAAPSGYPDCDVLSYPEPKAFELAQKADKLLLDAGGPFWGQILFP